MNSYERYYREKLYPLQDGVMSIIQKLDTPFFLTGGTALSRHYFNHRYSDDLDLFVNSYDYFHELLDKILKHLGSGKLNHLFRIEKDSIKLYENYAQIFIVNQLSSEIRLKIDFVNDVAEHTGDFEFDDILGRVDGWSNILSNKLTALFRFEPKDIVDIWIIALHKKLNWKTIVSDAKKKEAGVEPEVIFNIVKSFPIDKLEMIKWIVKPDFNNVRNDLNIIAEDIFFGKDNSLFGRR